MSRADETSTAGHADAVAADPAPVPAWLRWTAAVLAAGGVFVISKASLTRIFVEGNCCADDGYFALIAKTFATRLEYGLPVSDSEVLPFCAQVGCGPALILPGALAIALFGAQNWLPGLTAFAMLALQLAGFAWLLTRVYDRWRVVLVVAVALLAVIATTRHHFYYMMFLGEGPALGFVLLGVACLVVQQVRPRWVWVAGAMFGLAMLTKLIEAFTIAGALGVWFACRSAAVGRRSVGEALRLCAALAAPLLLYELTKLVCLGAGGWADHWREFSSFSKQLHRRPPGDDSSVLQILGEQYHLTWASAVFAAAMLGFVLFRFARAGERQRALLPLMLFGAALVHFVYCLKVSSHSGHYIWPAPLTLDFAIASSFVLMGARPLAVALAAFVAMFATPMAVVGYVEFHDSYLRRQTLAERRVVLAFLDEHRDATVVSQWWGSFYEIAYLLDDGRRWRLANDPYAVAGIDGPVVLNRHFLARNGFYDALVAACERREPELTLYELYLGGRGR